MVSYVCVKTVPDSTKLRLIKGPKSKFPQGSMPLILLVCHMLCTQICVCPHPLPPSNPYNLILPPLGQKVKKKPWLRIKIMFFRPKKCPQKSSQSIKFRNIQSTRSINNSPCAIVVIRPSKVVVLFLVLQVT